MSKITLFKTAKDVKRYNDTTINNFLDGVKNGLWWEQVGAVRAAKTKEQINAAKIRLSAVTIGGTFAVRNMQKVETLSGFISIDVDKVTDVEACKRILDGDTYIYSMFFSASKTGLCLIFEINIDIVNKFESRNDGFHAAYIAISDYLYKKYQILTDPKCKDVTRLRFVSHDPDLYLNENAKKFSGFQVPKKAKYLKPVVYVKTDLDEVVNQLCNSGVSLCEDYQDWLKTGWSLASTLGEAGRDSFHRLSAVSSKYDPKETDRKWDNLFKTHNDEKVSVKYLYHKAKEAGINPYSEKTEEIIRTAYFAKKDKTRSKEFVSSLLLEMRPDMFTQDEKEIIDDVVNQVFIHNIEPEQENTVLNVIDFINNYKLKYNEITNNLEQDGRVLSEREVTSIYIDCKIAIPKTSKDLVWDILFSNKVKQYNPLKEFFSTSNRVSGTENLDKLIKSITTDTDHVGLWVTKWLVSTVASVYGRTSPLVLVLCGAQNSGKTQWFRRLLPQKLKSYYTESKMDGGKDDEILMTKKLIIMDDEYGGKNKKEDMEFKRITSKDIITVRLPYGRLSVDLQRLCMLAGTSNPLAILNDQTGNRRILPINVLSLNHELYNSVDKDALWMELYQMFLDGYKYELTKDEIKMLNEATTMFEAQLSEEEAISGNFIPGDKNDPNVKWMTATDILNLFNEKSSIRYNATSLGLVLKKLGFERMNKRIKGTNIKRWVYPVKFINVDTVMEDLDELDF